MGLGHFARGTVRTQLLGRRVLRRVQHATPHPHLHRAFRHLLVQADPVARAVGDEVEAMRCSIGERSGSVDVLYSPRPGTATSNSHRPEHGKVLPLSFEQAARTGVARKWGEFLHLLARGTVLELGSCAGISGSYLATGCERLITVEGSPSLAALAQETIGRISDRATVVNALFDDAIDDLLDAGQPIDLAFIDGHHEKVATIHYFDRLYPLLLSGSVVVFDDIYWSDDMQDAWQELSHRTEFATAVNLGKLGVCVVGNGPPTQVNASLATGRWKPGTPWGWQD